MVPRHSRRAIGIETGDPVALAGTDFQSVVRLRDQVAIDALCREPDPEEFVKPEPEDQSHETRFKRLRRWCRNSATIYL